ncbi:tripartite tricarboxylate transporter substrate-binding protein [Aquincola sp. MAHUQ-54]|uniref:Tripartite tricarboxylate transporter substrate-binding protein n=1 Tax=Aquincola agrisoli TaxID=3119538 RepID=A0AAW9QIP4_9BURK
MNARIAGLALGAALVPALAAYPGRPITLVVPFAAGGPSDKVARDFAEALRRQPDNQTVVVENVGGASGTLGAARVAKAPPDGYTLLLHNISMGTSPALYRRLPYQTIADFEFLGLINEVPMTLVGRAALPARDFAELAAWMNAQREKVNMAHAGMGSASHLCGLLLTSAMKVPATTVPYKGTAPACAAMLSAPWAAAEAASLQLSAFDAGAGVVGIHVGADDVADLFAWQFSLRFDPALLSAASVSEGTFLAAAGHTFFDAGVIDNTAGTVSFVLASLLGPQPGASGTGPLATVLFNAIGNGTAVLSLADVLVLDSNLDAIAVGTDTITLAVPEPGGLWLFAAGLAGLAARRHLPARPRHKVPMHA